MAETYLEREQRFYPWRFDEDGNRAPLREDAQGNRVYPWEIDEDDDKSTPEPEPAEKTAENPPEENTMSDETPKTGELSFLQAAELVYGKETRAEKGEAEPEEPATTEAPNEKREPGKRTFEEMAAKVYAGQESRFAQVLGDARVASVIRDKEGFIIHGGDSPMYHADIRDMISYYAPYLRNADLSDVDFANRELRDAMLMGADLRGTVFHGRLEGNLRNANLSGADLSGCNFGFSDLRGAEFDSSTNIAGADFTNAKFRVEDLKRCQGWEKAKGLKMGREKD